MPNKNIESIATRGSVPFFLTGCRSPPALKITKTCPTPATQTETTQNKISSRREGNSADKVVIHTHALVTKDCCLSRTVKAPRLGVTLLPRILRGPASTRGPDLATGAWQGALRVWPICL